MEFLTAFLIGGLICVIGQTLIAGCGATVPLTGFGYTLAKGTE